MGDIVSLVEKAQEQFDEVSAARLSKRIAKNQFNLNDFLQQIQQIKKMGNMKDLVGMIPGIGKAVKDLDVSNDSFKHIEAIIHSMTAKEREDPQLINGNRRSRIAAGSGRTIQEVNKLLKQFDEMRKMMRMMSNKDQMRNMMRQSPGMRK
jgi:signal recognition particle subunit SRP54